MTPTFNFNISLVFNEAEDDLDIRIQTDAENIDTVKLAAIAMFFKEAMTSQTEAMAGLAVEYGKLANTLDEQRDDWE